MRGKIIFGLLLFVGLILGSMSIKAYNGSANMEDPYETIQTTAVVERDTVPPVKERSGDFVNDKNNNPFDLKDPSAIEQKVEYDPKTGLYMITEKVGNAFFRPPTYLTFEQFMEWSKKQSEEQYFIKLSRNTSGGGSNPLNSFDLKKELEARSIFGSPGVDIRPQGNIDLTFGADFQRIDNPVIPERQRRQGGFDFDMNIQMNVIGNIGDKMKLQTNYNTQASFDFENQMKLEYTGHEDEIMQKIQAGNVSFPLKSQLIQGSQSLFGIYTEMKFGKLTVKNILSQQKSRRQQIQLQGGSQQQDFEVTADRYDENRHFFLSHYNRDNYERALQNLPQVNTQFQVTKIEVWVTNTRNATEGVRDVVAIADLGEPDRKNVAVRQPALYPPAQPIFRDLNNQGLPADSSNPIYNKLVTTPQVRNLNNAVAMLQSSIFNMQQVRDFEKVRARKLSQNEYSFDPELGYISLNLQLQPEDVLGVAYEYTYNGEFYRVGEFAQESPINNDSLSVLFLKMLKSSSPRVDLPIWDLMMKNVYSLGAFQISQEDFKLDVFYQDPGGGEKRFIPEGRGVADRQLIGLLNLDNLNSVGDPIPNGVFDFVPGVTINPRNGRIIFPVLEPFGSSLYSKFDTINEAAIAEKYVYRQLYDSTVIIAREYPEFNRYVIRGTYRSSFSTEISLGAFNIPRGSVTVTGGGQRLVEGVDYEVDYNIGRIKILNESILNAGQPINVSYEDNSLFSFQTRTMLGTRLDYEINENFIIGGTHLRLSERPFTQKVNYGDDPINNNIYGLDLQYSTEAPWLTKLVDKLPLISTKEKSEINVSAEAAWLRPGHNKAVRQGEEKDGIVYVDDFEGASSFFDLRIPATNWVLASVPRNNKFPEAEMIDSLEYGMNRAKLAWYQIDNNLRRNSPTNNPYERLVQETEVFPNRQLDLNQNIDIRPMDLAYYPNQRGPYNFDTEPIPGLTAGMNKLTGELNAPETRWAGIMRSIQNNNFEQQNIEFIEFWLLSPFIDGAGGNGGNLYLNLGNISEDILRDSRNFFENGLPGEDEEARLDTTNWGRIPRVIPVTNAFDNNEATRLAQDVGLDGFNNEDEASFFSDYVDWVAANVPLAAQAVSEDPSNDDFEYYNTDEQNANDVPILDRYLRFNNPQGNSQPPTGNQVSASINIPDSEDINRDNSLNESESYFEYKIPIRRDGIDPNGMALSDFVTNVVNGEAGQQWYQFKVPLDQFTERIGGIQDFRSIRFIRMYLKDFNQPVVMRFARFALVRNQWRRYRRSLLNPGLFEVPSDEDDTKFDLNAVSIEENSSKFPFPYVLPPGIQREQTIGSITNALQNEQALAINICDLKDGDARGIYKNINMDWRTFNELRMFVHAESQEDLAPGELSMFMRIGSDYEKNYYEYEVPLTMTTPGTSPTGGDPNQDEDYKEQVWLNGNSFDFPLELLRELKVRRNNNPNASLAQLFEGIDPNKPQNIIRIKGNPDLGLVKGVMIGIRNTTGTGVPICAELWVNELRLSGFDERGGAAAIARVDMKVADVGNISGALSYSTIGFGSLDQKLAQRSKEEVLQYDIAANLELGKFFPSKFGLRIPLYAQLSNTFRTPQFDPYQLDIPLKQLLEATPNGAARDSLKRQAQDYTSIRSLNFTNVRKERTNKAAKPMPWSIDNFSLTYAYSQTLRSDPTILSDKIDLHRFSFDYGYAISPKYITPFKKLIDSKNKNLKFVRDFNFNLIPNAVNFNTDLTRHFGTTTYRFADGLNNTWYDKRFNWNRNFGLQWNLTRTINFNFNSTTFSAIDEPDEAYIRNNPNIADFEQYRRDSIWDALRDLGRIKNYQHSASLSVTVPTRKIPFLDWMQIKGQYNTTYSWSAAALNLDSLGNVIQNTQSRQASVDLDFVKFYNKSKYLKKINSRARPTRGRTPAGKTKPGDKKETQSKADRKKEKQRAKAEKKRNKKNKGEEPEEEKNDVKNEKDQKPAEEKPLTKKERAKQKAQAKKEKEKEKKRKAKEKKKQKRQNRQPSKAERIIIRPLMVVRKVRVTLNEQFSSVVPGFTPAPRFVGLSQGFDAPGLEYAFGLQPTTAWLDRAAGNGWITDNIYQNQQVLLNTSQNFDGRVTLEPFESFRIDVTINRNFTESHSEFFKVKDNFSNEFEHLTPRDIGSLSMTYFSMQTMFETLIDGKFSQTFRNFEENRKIISQRLGTGLHATDPGYTEGYGRIQQDVLIPAFIAAYTKKDANTVDLDLFNQLPLPNWRMTYNGLSKLDMFKDIFASVNISHGYRSNFTVNSFVTDLDFDFNDPFRFNPTSDNYYSEFEIPDLVITEQFSPLIGIDVRTRNDVTARVDFKKSRTLGLSFRDFQLSETRSTEFTIGMGYRIKNFVMPGKKKGKSRNSRNDNNEKEEKDNRSGGRAGGGQSPQGNDVNFKFDFSFRDDITVNHLIDQGNSIITRGLRTIRISPSIDYALNQRLNLRFFFDQSRTIPKISNSFPIFNTQAGVTVRFALTP